MTMSDVSEQAWTIDTGDGARIHGVTNSVSDGENDKCVVLVHGLTGHMNQYQIKTAAMRWPQRGYDVIRFNLYTDAAGGRRLDDCTLAIHAADLNRVIDTRTASYEHVFAAGHSYGGPTIMVAQPTSCNAVSLWDPSFNLPEVWARIPVTEIGGRPHLDWRIRHLLNDEYVQEARDNYDTAACLDLSRALGRPIQVIHAGASHYATDGQSWHSAGHPDNERRVVDGAEHSFYNGTCCDELLAMTVDFFDRHSENTA